MSDDPTGAGPGGTDPLSTGAAITGWLRTLSGRAAASRARRVLASADALDSASTRNTSPACSSKSASS